MPVQSRNISVRGEGREGRQQRWVARGYYMTETMCVFLSYSVGVGGEGGREHNDGRGGTGG